jgi:pimeloyl-ACP methyl ester carboxylesterase
VAWLTAARLPERVERMVALSVGHPAAWGKPTLEALQKGWYRLLFLFEGVAEELVRRDNWYLLRELLQGYRDVEQAIVELERPGALAAGLSWYRANLPVQRLLGPPPALPPVRAPTLGIWSGGDLYLTEERMLRSAEHVQGPWRYERFDHASHWIPLDEPERLNALLLEFLGPPTA